MWKVQCEGWGGMTGHRVAMLKENGKEKVFASEQDAQAEAKRLREAARSPYSCAQFSYAAVEVWS